MRTFKVFLPDGAEPALAAERARFVRDGFSWPALLFGPFWLLARGLWLALIIWILGAVLVSLAIRNGYLAGGAGGWLYFLSVLFLGVEGRKLVAGAVERRGLVFADVIVAPNRSTAEEIFFNRWPFDAGPPPSSPPSPRANIAVAPTHVIGMFPEAGG